MIPATLASALLAFSLFGLATSRHHEKHLGRKCGPALARRLRAGAWCLLLLAYVLAFAAWGAVFGAIGGTGIIMLAAATAFLALNLAPGRSRR